MIPIESYVGYYFFLFSFYCYLEKEKNSAKLKKKKKKKGRYSLRTTRIVWIELLLSSYLKRKKGKDSERLFFSNEI